MHEKRINSVFALLHNTPSILEYLVLLASTLKYPPNLVNANKEILIVFAGMEMVPRVTFKKELYAMFVTVVGTIKSPFFDDGK